MQPNPMSPARALAAPGAPVPRTPVPRTPVPELAVPAQNHIGENQPVGAARNQQANEIPPSRDSAQRSQRGIPAVGNDVQGRQLPAGDLAVPRPPAQNHPRRNQPLEAARNQLVIESPHPQSSRDSFQRSQRGIPVGNDFQGRQLPFIQPPRAEINPNMAQLAQTFIPIIESILAISQSIVWVLSLFFFFVVLVVITLRIVRFFFPLDTMTDSPRLLFRLVGSGYSNAATIYEMVFPLSISNPFLFIVILLGAIVVTRSIAYCVKVCSTSPRC